MSTNQRKSRRRLALKILALGLAALAIWVVYDLYAPRTAHLREFEPDEVARPVVEIFGSRRKELEGISTRHETTLWSYWERGRPARN